MNLVEEVRQAWGWIGLEAEEIIGENDFGHLIVKDKQGKYWRISPEELSCEVWLGTEENLMLCRSIRISFTTGTCALLSSKLKSNSGR